MKPFLRWWLIVCCTCVGVAFFVIYGGVNYVNEADFTKISFAIFIGFVYFSIRVGICTYKGYGDLSVARFAAGVFIKLGMTGTVLGFIYMLSTCFANINTQNIVAMQSVLSQMATGMSTALVTTATGLICNIILNLQIFNFEKAMK